MTEGSQITTFLDKIRWFIDISKIRKRKVGCISMMAIWSVFRMM